MASNPRLIDLRGLQFGNWTVIEKAGNDKRGGAKWEALCACGTRRAVLGADLRRGVSVSCGCLGSRKTIGDRNKTHGQTNTRLYHIWKNMIRRCADANNKNYGGRGISVFREWLAFETFYSWAIASGYSDSLTIERVDVNGHYCPLNCKWIRKEDQARNKTNNLRAPDGRLWAEIAEQNGISRTAFRCRLSAAGWSIQDAATTPMRRRKAGERDASGRWVRKPSKEWRR